MTRPEEEPTHSKSENGSIVKAVGIGFASVTVGGSGKSCRGVYVVIPSPSALRRLGFRSCRSQNENKKLVRLSPRRCIFALCLSTSTFGLNAE